MERDWARLAEALASARRATGMTQDELAGVLGVGRSTVQKLERGHAYAKTLPVHREAARALGWTDDSIEAVLAGGEPRLTPVPDSAGGTVVAEPVSRIEAGVDALLDDLTARVKDTLLGGQVVDATAIDIGPDDDGGVVIIWKRGADQDLTPEQQRQLRRRWARLQRAAHEILADDEDVTE